MSGVIDEAFRMVETQWREQRAAIHEMSELANSEASAASAMQAEQGVGIVVPARVAASLAGLQAAADARARALQALATGGEMAATAEAQDVEHAARIAESREAIHRYNNDVADGRSEYEAALDAHRFSGFRPPLPDDDDSGSGPSGAPAAPLPPR